MAPVLISNKTKINWAVYFFCLLNKKARNTVRNNSERLAFLLDFNEKDFEKIRLNSQLNLLWAEFYEMELRKTQDIVAKFKQMSKP